MHNQYSAYSCVLGGSNLEHIEEIPLDPAIEQAIVQSSGSLLPTNLFVAKQESKFNGKTHDLFRLLDAGELAVPLETGVALGTAQPSYIQYRRRAENGWATGSSHFRVKSFNGFLWIESIDASQDDKKLATANFVLYCLTDGSGNYLLAQTNQALIGNAAMSDAGYTLGPLYIDDPNTSVATLIEGNTKYRHESGIVYEGSRDAGKLEARQGAVKATHPKASFSVKHLPDLITYGCTLKHVTNVTQYLQAVDENGRRVAPGTPSHISINFPLAKLEPNKLGGGNEQSDAMLDYVAHAIENAGFDTVEVAVGVTIP